MKLLELVCGLFVASAGLFTAREANAQSADTLRLPLRWHVADGRHATADSLGRPSGVAVDIRGYVYVSDMSSAKVWVFDPAGRSMPAIGRKGKGPGEFDSPTGAAISPDGRLVIRDATLVARFRSDPTTGRLTTFDGAFRGPSLVDWRSTRATRFASDGRVFHPAYSFPRPTTRSARYNIYNLSGALLDSLVVPVFPGVAGGDAYVILGHTDGRILPGLGHVPFAPQASWDITPDGLLVSGVGSEYRLRVTDKAGRVVREIRRTVTPVRIPADERRDSVRALRARLDSLTVPLNQVEGLSPDVKAMRLPETFPLFSDVFAAADSTIWVRRVVPAAAQRTAFDVFDRAGRYVRVVELPLTILSFPTPSLSFTAVAGITIDQESGAPGVAFFALPTARPSKR